MVDFVPLGALSSPGAPDPDLAGFHIKVKHGILNISLYVCNNKISVQMLSFGLAGYTYADVLPERNSSSKLRQAYENGADYSNLKIS